MVESLFVDILMQENLFGRKDSAGSFVRSRISEAIIVYDLTIKIEFEWYFMLFQVERKCFEGKTERKEFDKVSKCH